MNRVSHHFGFSTDENVVKKWIQTVHIHTQLRQAFRTVLSIKTSSRHRLLTKVGKWIKKFKDQLHACKFNSFSFDKPKLFFTGAEIRYSVVSNMFAAKKIGNEKNATFIVERLINQVAFYERMLHTNFNCGFKKEK